MYTHAALCRIIVRSTSLAALCVALASCGLFPDKTPHTHARHHLKQPHYLADDYVVHVSLATLKLTQDPTDIAAVTPDIDVVQAYTTQKPAQKKTLFQSIAIISYTVKGKTELQRTVAPISLQQKGEAFPQLLSVMKALGSKNYTLHDIEPAVLAIAPMAPLELSENDAQQTRAILDNQLAAELQDAQTLPLAGEAQVQVRLAKFFTNAHIKEAAYLCVENAKQDLAKLSESPQGNTPTTKSLSQQLDEIENKLNKTMPYSLGTL